MKRAFLKKLQMCWKAFFHPEQPKVQDFIRPAPIVYRTLDAIPVVAQFRVPHEHHVPEEFIKRQLCQAIAEYIEQNISLNVKAEREQYATVYSVRLSIVPEDKL